MRVATHTLSLLFFILFLFSCGNSKNKTHSKTTTKTTKTYPSTKKPTSTSSTGSDKSDNEKINKTLSTAKSYFGTKYKYGGTDKKGIDCSGLMCVSYQSVGVQLPRTSNEQSTIGSRVYIEELALGDLIFFGDSPNSKKITHVGIISYVSPKSIKFIHASTRAGVVESELLSDWYKPRYIKAVRPLK